MVFMMFAVKGQKRVRVLMKKGGAPLMEHLKKLLETSKLMDDSQQHPNERGNHFNETFWIAIVM